MSAGDPYAPPAAEPGAEGGADRPSRSRPSFPWSLEGPAFARSTWLFGRLLGAVFLLAFASLHVQILGLIGERGVRPAVELRGVAAERLGPDAFFELPSVLWWWGAGDGALVATCLAGELAAALLLVGLVPGLASLTCWFLYLSLVSFGAPFLPLQWDTLLLEAGFLSAFLFGRLVRDDPRRPREPPWPARWALGFLAFRLHFASGVVKLASGDPSWRGLRALSMHFETQPLPNPVAYWAHQLPAPVLTAATAATLFAELVVPLGLLVGGRRVRHGSALTLVGLHVAIASTGNYGFFNLLSAALLVPFLDDRFSARLTPAWLRRRLGWGAPARVPTPRGWTTVAAVPSVVVSFFAAVQLALAVRAGPAVPQLAIDATQAVAPFRVANGYGLFAVMTTSRPELVIEGSRDGETWKPFRFRFKPGALDRGPAQVAPHMPRLDWQLWFAALSDDWRRHAWVVSLLERLLEGDRAVLGLLDGDPFHGRPPAQIRVLRYDYAFTSPDVRADTGRVWRRTALGRWGPRLVAEPDPDGE